MCSVEKVVLPSCEKDALSAGTGREAEEEEGGGGEEEDGPLERDGVYMLLAIFLSPYLFFSKDDTKNKRGI